MAHQTQASGSGRGRGAAVAIAVFYSLLFVAMIWPVYPRFATIEPRVFAMPFALWYVVVGLLVSFFVLFGYYLWEKASGSPDSNDDGGGTD